MALRPHAFGAFCTAKLDFSEELEFGAHCRDLSEPRPCGKDYISSLLSMFSPSRRDFWCFQPGFVSCQVPGRTQRKDGRHLWPHTCSLQFSSVAQLCLTLCDPMNRSTPDLPVHHHLPEFTQAQSIESVMLSSHLILGHPLLLLPPISPSIRVFPMSQLFA